MFKAEIFVLAGVVFLKIEAFKTILFNIYIYIYNKQKHIKNMHINMHYITIYNKIKISIV